MGKLSGTKMWILYHGTEEGVREDCSIYYTDSELFDVWCYLYGINKGSDIHLNTVLIFIDENDIYQGHLAYISDILVEGLIIGN